MSTKLAVIHGQLIDGTEAEPIPDGVVLMEDKTVTFAGPAEGCRIPEQTTIIDASGKTVMPGLIEAHAHVGGGTKDIQTLRLSLQRGITTVCSVSANLKGIELRQGIDAGHLRGCARLVAGCIVTPTHGHVTFRTADGPWEVRKAVREMVMAGADFIKTAASGGFWAADETCAVRNYTPVELEALADEAHAWNVPVVVHAHTQPGLNNAIAAGIDQIHHGAFIDEEALRGIHAKGLYFVPTLRVTSDRNIDAWPDRPWMMAEMRESQPLHRAGVRRAHELGINLACGTDYPGSAHGWAIGDATHFEMMELVKAGLSPLETIIAATRTNAKAYGKLDRFGTLEAGKLADLIMVNGDPLDTIGVLYNPAAIAIVVKEGQVEYTDEANKHHYTVASPQPADRFQGG